MMNQVEEMRSKKQKGEDDDDDHENDMVMPGFRFHPTEEELVEFYLRRKVEGKRFNVELITFLDLYRFDPWELPALAAIGEKEWFFYVPRDRKYRNGDRPNRVTTSGYWKATGADRMIRTDNLMRSIGLKKTLVFYSGKAPKGIRSSWIMNEYRLPQQETQRLQKAEISLCRVYKRTGVEERPSLPRSLQTTNNTSRPANHKNNKHHTQNSSSFHCFESIEDQSSHHTNHKITETSSSNPTNSSYYNIISTTSSAIQTLNNCMPLQLFDVHNYQHNVSSDYSPNLLANSLLPPLQPQPEVQPQLQLEALNNMPGTLQVTFPDRLLEWSSMLISEESKEFIDPF